MDEKVYRLDGVSYFYNGVEALAEVGLDVIPGECLAVLGANGSGKSTLLKLMNGLMLPTKGVVSFKGKPMDEEDFNSAGFRSTVSFVFSESDAQLFSSSVFEEVAFGPRQLDISEEEVNERVEDTLDLLGMSSLVDRAPYTLSTGEKKKLSIASVLSIGPEVLLLDEPTNGLDPRSQVWLIELLFELLKAGKTIVIATHDLSLAEDLSDRVVVLDESHRVAAVGSVAELLGDKDLLLKTNLIHEHAHRHGDFMHTHSHGPFAGHDEHE